METTIFYSWQSDLPNKKNRGFIQDCIEKAAKVISKANIHLEIAVDRDTLSVTGTPDIAASIFSKIDQAKIFIADISIINSHEPGRKTPNPNVLVELGYAAKALGWSNVIAIFNTEFGSVEDLPFDLRFRRPLIYRITNEGNKSGDRSALVRQLRAAIESIMAIESEKDQIKLYIKQQIDKEILSVCNQIHKVLYGYVGPFDLQKIWPMLTLSGAAIENLLAQRLLLGFTVLKEWRVFMEKIQSAMDRPFFVQQAGQVYVTSLIKVIRGLEAVTVIFGNPKLFIDAGQETDEYRIVEGQQMNPDNPSDSYLLIRPLQKKGDYVVVDFGTIRKFNLPRAKKMLTINPELSFSVPISIHELLQGIDAWIMATGKSLIVDPLTFKHL